MARYQHQVMPLKTTRSGFVSPPIISRFQPATRVSLRGKAGDLLEDGLFPTRARRVMSLFQVAEDCHRWTGPLA